MMNYIKQAAYSACLGTAVLFGSALASYSANAMSNVSDTPKATKATAQNTTGLQKVDYDGWRWRHRHWRDRDWRHRYWRDRYYWRDRHWRRYYD